MTDSLPHVPTTDDTGLAPEPDSTTGTPRWVKVSMTIVLVVGLLFAVVLVTGGPGAHGPGRHSGGGASEAPASGGTESDGGPSEAPNSAGTGSGDAGAHDPSRRNH